MFQMVKERIRENYNAICLLKLFRNRKKGDFRDRIYNFVSLQDIWKVNHPKAHVIDNPKKKFALF